VFQAMFFTKNLMLKNKLGHSIRGKNSQANLAIVFFVIFIAAALYTSLSPPPTAPLPQGVAFWAAFGLKLGCLIVGALSLWDLGDSWRVGVIDEQQTALIDSGVYRYSRNPYFVSYLLMFSAYALLLQSGLLLLLLCGGFLIIHNMILREEVYLAGVHGDAYAEYCKRVPRYLLL
jgi:protein-S-isoprenylcysteine O-methyltransferase Ste14